MKTRRHHRAAAAVESIIQKSSGDLNGPNPTRFLAPLPAEIVIKIASYLSQRDCLTCTAVCSSWYTSAPYYMQSLWRYVSISSNDFAKRRLIWEQCVREYAKQIVLKYTSNYYNLAFTIQKLVDCQCRKVESLELAVPCKISKKRVQALLSLSNRIGDQLTQLTIIDVFTNMNVLDAVQTFPNLAKLSYNGQTVNWQVQSHLRPPLLPQFSSLTHLYLDFPVNMKLQLEPILQSSPNLQFLIYGERRRLSIQQRPAPSTVTSLEDISIWCPKLTYLEARSGTEFLYYRSKLLADMQRNKAATMGLRSLMTSECSGYGINQARPYLLNHASTLEFVGLECIFGPSLAMNKLRTPQLRSLCLISAVLTFFRDHVEHSTGQPWNIVLPECPLLETLHISEACEKKSQLDLSILKNFKKLKHLHLSKLTLIDHSNVFKNMSVTHGAKITSITLDEVYPVNDETLQAISNFPMLQRLKIAFSADNYSCTNDGLIRFSSQLSQTSIQELSFLDLQSQCLPPLFLQAIGKISTLHTIVARSSFRIIHHLSVDALDILKMLEYTTSLKNVDLAWLKVTGIDSSCSIASFLEQNLRGYKVEVDELRSSLITTPATSIQLTRT